MSQKEKSRRWRDGMVGVALIALISAYHFDLFEREPYPVLRSELQVEDTYDAFAHPRFRWLDNDRIVVLAGERPDPRAHGRRRMIHAMKAWDIRSNDVRTLMGDDVDALCLADGYFRIMVRKDAPGGAEALEFYAGHEDSLRKVSPGRYDGMSCRPIGEVPLPDWTKSIRDPEINLKRLRPEHGFLVIDRDSPTDWPRSIRLYRPGETREHGIDLSGMLGKHVPSPVVMGIYATWYSHQGAYYVRSLRGGEPSWWLYPTGRLGSAWTIPASGINFRNKKGSGTPIASTVTMPLMGTTDYDIRFIGDGGLYSITDFSNPERLVKGRIGQELEVSPDGCKVAYANDERIHIDRDAPRHIYKLQIITLCPEKQP